MPSASCSGVNENGVRFQNEAIQFDRIPDECPHCHFQMIPEGQGGGWIVRDILEIVYRCTNPKCSRSFIALHAFAGRTGSSRIFNFQRSIPVQPKEVVVDEEIAKLSPSFAKILAQAQAAEGYGLDEIAGPGFRKALEFLIKDYAISLVADEQSREEIRQIMLGAVIAKYLNGDKLPVVSKRAAWLGNDQTHYEQRWVGKDLQDLKKLISAVEHFIAMEQLVAELPAQMPDRK